MFARSSTLGPVDTGSAAPQLNAEQRRVVEHGDGPLLVIAGAGTGKTKTLAARVADLIDRGVRPERILLLTFSRRAAAEMLRRAGQVTDPAAARRVWGGTFHAIGHRLLRVHGAALGLGAGFSVLDRGDAAELMGLVRSEVATNLHDRRFPRKDTLLAIYSRVANTQRPLREVLDRAFPWCAADPDMIAMLFSAYADRKRAQALLDFDDLLLFWASATRQPHVGARLEGLFDHVLVDEYQDTNRVQAEIVGAMTRTAAGVMVVGDDAQAIYGFRAATVRNILDFPSQYPGTTIVALEENYRSTPPILAVANAVIAQAAERHDKQLWSNRPTGRRPRLVTCADEQSQADEVCDTVLAHYEEGTALRDQVVLFRAAHHSDLLEVELTRRGIPFVKYGGLRFLEAAHIKDLLALLRVLDNPYDELAWFRVLQLVDGIGPTSARRLLGIMGVRPRSGDARHPVERVLDAGASVRAAARRELADLGAALAACADGDRIEAAAQVARLRQFLDPVVRRRYDHPESRLHDLEELEHVAVAYGTRAQLVAELVLDPPAATSDLAEAPSLDEDYLVLSTVHSAKGGEWDTVHVIHAADGMFPSDLATRDAEEIDEERRLFYVALTRARDHLHVYFPLRYFHRRVGHDDRHHYAQLTRFVPLAIQDLFERHAPSAPTGHALAAVAGPTRPVGADIDQALEALWR
jgi:DNA helicase-2/ATP-dependent DNA helicase PcrA